MEDNMKNTFLHVVLTGIVGFSLLICGCKNPASNESFNTSGTPLTLEVIENGTIILTNPDRVVNLRYKIDNEEFVSVSVNSEIAVTAGNKVSFFGEGTTNTDSVSFNINCSSDCYIYGNIMSLLAEDYQTATEITQDYAFSKLFFSNTHIKNSPTKELELPATILSKYCYHYMFADCDALTSSPILPATDLAEGCYFGMFAGCNVFINPPSLPAKNLAKGCYYSMFYNCGSLATPPSLPATNLTEYCYFGMFEGCYSLTSAPSLPATNLALCCYEYMFGGCKALKVAPSLPASKLASACYSYMFYNCSSLSVAPNLPALNLTEYCYKCMFTNCTSLTTSPILPAVKLAKECYIWMFDGCTKLNYITCMAKDISADSCTSYWVTDVSSSGTFIRARNVDWSVKTGNNGIPSGWTVIEVD